MKLESSVTPSPCVSTTHTLCLFGGLWIGSLGSCGDGLICGRRDRHDFAVAPAAAAKAARQIDSLMAICVDLAPEHT